MADLSAGPYYPTLYQCQGCDRYYTRIPHAAGWGRDLYLSDEVAVAEVLRGPPEILLCAMCCEKVGQESLARVRARLQALAVDSEGPGGGGGAG